MKSEGQCRTGGAIEQSPIPYPIGKGLPQSVTPRPLPEPKRKGKRAQRPSGPLTQEQAAAICAAYQAGGNALDVANRFGISRTHVYSLLKAAGIPTRGNS